LFYRQIKAVQIYLLVAAYYYTPVRESIIAADYRCIAPDRQTRLYYFPTFALRLDLMIPEMENKIEEKETRVRFSLSLSLSVATFAYDSAAV